jgi:hypothetical protein
MEARLMELEQRLARAERQVNVLRGLGLATLAMAVAVLAVRPASPQNNGSVLKAPFRVVDAGGKELLRVDAGPQGAVFRLFSSQGVTVAEIKATSPGSGSFVLAEPGVKLLTDKAQAFLRSKR